MLVLSVMLRSLCIFQTTFVRPPQGHRQGGEAHSWQKNPEAVERRRDETVRPMLFCPFTFPQSQVLPLRSFTRHLKMKSENIPCLFPMKHHLSPEDATCSELGQSLASGSPVSDSPGTLSVKSLEQFVLAGF